MGGVQEGEGETKEGKIGGGRRRGKEKEREGREEDPRVYL